MSIRHLPCCLGLLFLCAAVAAASPAFAVNNCLWFDGVDDYVTVPDALDLRGPLTLEAWVKIDVEPSGGRIISNRQGSNGFEMDLFRDGDQYEFRFSTSGTAAVWTFVNDAPGRWVHFAVTFEGGTGIARIYIDGAEVNWGNAYTEIQASPGPLRLGAMGTAAFFYRGYMDEVRIWSAVLDGATIASWMSRPLVADHPNYADLEGYWNFDEGSGQVVDNLTGDARRDGELGSGSGEDSHDPLWQTDGAPVPVDATTMGRIKQHFLKP